MIYVYNFAVINENILLAAAPTHIITIALLLCRYYYSTFRAIAPSHRYSTRINETTKHGGFSARTDKTAKPRRLSSSGE